MAMAVARPAATRKLKAYYELTKPGITLAVALSMAAGYLLGLPEGIRGVGQHGEHFLLTLLGTVLVSGGSGALNHFAEWTTDQLMPRTRRRPIASGLLSPRQGLAWGIVLCTAGLAVLLFVDFLVLLLATLTVVLYIVVYTPMKRRSATALYLGAVPGALPAAGGWIAASGPDWGALLVFAVLYLWQLPHFLALAWLYRKDYEQAGFPVLSLGELGKQRVGRQLVLASVGLGIAGGVLGAYLRASLLFILGSLFLAALLLGLALWFVRNPSFTTARQVLHGAYVYLFGFVALSGVARL
jgi:protoheme IX farnesyltransferase